jgi:hypothetical protein
MDDVTQAIGCGYKLGESLKEEPTLVGCLLRYACIAIASRALKVSSQYGNISEPQARRLFDLAGNINLPPGLVCAVKGERASGLDMMERVRKYGLQALDKGKAAPANYASPSSIAVIGSWLMDLRSCTDELFYVKYMDRMVDEASRPYRGRISQQLEGEPDFPPYGVMSAILTPVFSKVKPKLYEAMAIQSGDRAFLAVLAYKAKFGNYPSGLDDVEKRLGWKLPTDPLAGGPFHYRIDRDGFVLYGLGRGMKDDDARTVEATRSTDEHPYSNGDGRYSANMIWQKDR